MKLDHEIVAPSGQWAAPRISKSILLFHAWANATRIIQKPALIRPVERAVVYAVNYGRFSRSNRITHFVRDFRTLFETLGLNHCPLPPNDLVFLRRTNNSLCVKRLVKVYIYTSRSCLTASIGTRVLAALFSRPTLWKRESALRPKRRLYSGHWLRPALKLSKAISLVIVFDSRCYDVPFRIHEKRICTAPIFFGNLPQQQAREPRRNALNFSHWRCFQVNLIKYFDFNPRFLKNWSQLRDAHFAKYLTVDENLSMQKIALLLMLFQFSPCSFLRSPKYCSFALIHFHGVQNVLLRDSRSSWRASSATFTTCSKRAVNFWSWKQPD